MIFHLILTTLLLALSGVLGAPTSSNIRLSPGSWADTSLGLVVHNTGYQGDGIYKAVFNDAGVATVNFTPVEHLNLTIPSSIANPEPYHTKRQIFEGPQYRVTCTKNCGNDEGELKEITGYFAQATGNAHTEPSRWIWMWYKGHTAFACVYAQGDISAGWIYYYNTQINTECGPKCYGYTRGNYPQENVWDLSVGRTFQGDHFCTKKFTGY